MSKLQHKPTKILRGGQTLILAKIYTRCLILSTSMSNKNTQDNSQLEFKHVINHLHGRGSHCVTWVCCTIVDFLFFHVLLAL